MGQKDGKYGYFTGEGADTFCPFSSGDSDYPSVISLTGGTNSGVYRCVKDTTALFALWGSVYAGNGISSYAYITINGTSLVSYSGTTSFNDFRQVDLKEGDTIIIAVSTGASNVGAIACMFHNGGIY